jgi:hypothetical protein
MSRHRNREIDKRIFAILDADAPNHEDYTARRLADMVKCPTMTAWRRKKRWLEDYERWLESIELPPLSHNDALSALADLEEYLADAAPNVQKCFATLREVVESSDTGDVTDAPEESPRGKKAPPLDAEDLRSAWAEVLRQAKGRGGYDARKKHFDAIDGWQRSIED